MISFWVIAISMTIYSLFLNLRIRKSVRKMKTRCAAEKRSWPFKSDGALFGLLAFSPGLLEEKHPEIARSPEIRIILLDRKRWLIAAIICIPLFLISALIEIAIRA